MENFPNPETKTSVSIEEVEVLQSEYAGVVRQYSRGQTDIWKLIPYMALMADGKSGFSSQYSSAYRDGIWRLSNIRHNYYQYGVDCDNGEVIYCSNPEKAITDNELITINVAELNAQRILEHLTEKSRQEVADYMPKDAEELQAWRQEIIEEAGLTPVYERQHIITKEEMSQRTAKGIGEDMAG